MDATLTWLHLSDLHCQKRTGWNARRVLDALCRDLDDLEHSHGLTPDLLLFTGDAAFGQLPGAPIRGQFDQAADFFERLRTVCALPPENVFLVPGNHDVNRSKVMPQDSEWLKALRRDHDLDAIHEMFRSGGKELARLMERLADYRAFLKRVGYRHLLTDPKRLHYVEKRRIRGIDVAIAGLNSAWSCHDEDEKGRLWLAGEWQVAAIEPELEGAQVRIGLMHHPRGWFCPAEDPDLEALFERAFDFHLHGHEHKTWVKPLADGTVRIAAGACYERSDRENGYSLVRLDFESGKAEVWLRRYDRDSAAWVQRIHKTKTDAYGVWHLDPVRCFTRSTTPTVPATSGDRVGSLVNEVFHALPRNSIVMLLAQDDHDQREVIAALKERAGTKRPVLHVTPPPSASADLGEYFDWLRVQIGGERKISSSAEWEGLLHRRLSRGEELFLLVSGFARGPHEGRVELGAALRNLVERYDREFWVVVVGRERLAALKFEQGVHSVLNSAELLAWPELSAQDVLHWQRRDFPEVKLAADAATEIVELCGGHPRLIFTCLERRRSATDGTDREALSKSDVLWQLFTPYRTDEGPRRQICNWLAKDDLGPDVPWPADPLLRRFYWRNALVIRDRKLRWRCEAVREVGRQVLECGD